MDISAFYTAEQQGVTAKGKGGANGGAGGDFLAIMMANLMQPGFMTGETKESALNGSESPTLLTQPDLQQSVQLIDGRVQRSGDAIAAQLALMNKVTGGADLQTGDIEGSLAITGDVITPKDLNISQILLVDGTELGEGENLAQQLQNMIDAAEDSGSAGILFNLTPAQMVQLQKDIKAGKMQAPDGFSLVLMKAADGMAQGLAAGVDGQDFKNRINDLLTKSSASDYLEIMNIKDGTDKFSVLLKNAAAMKAAQAGDAGKAANALQNATAGQAGAAANAADTSSPLSALAGWPFMDGDLFSSLNFDNLSLQQMGISTGNAAHVTGLAALTNVATQSSPPSYAHPGTALVAAQLNKAASNGQAKSITLQLDPPELGRVEIKMQVGKDKSIKAKIISEKPEAHLMLQRDVSTLERALQEAGLDTADGSLSFELADDGQGFGQDGRHDGSRNQANGQNSDDGEMEIISTTMTWFVDPESGHTHYSILV